MGNLCYIWISEGGLYLAVIYNLDNRQIISWAIGNRMKRDLAICTLNMAVAQS